MAQLAINGHAVPLQHDGSARFEDVPVGQTVSAFDGTPRSSVRGYVRRLDVPETAWMPEAEASNIIAELQATPPLTVTGDWPGSISAIITGSIKQRFNFAPGGTLVRLAFSLLEA